METRTIRNVVIKGEEIEDLKMAGASAKVFRVWCGFKAAENKDGGASVTEIATLLGISVRQVRKQMDWLEAEGFITAPDCNCCDHSDEKD